MAMQWLLNAIWQRDLTTSEVTISKPKRPIEPLSKTRNVPMRILVLSLCRTSEIPLGQALKTLGYKPFGMAEGMKDPAFFYGQWHKAALAKYSGVGKQWGREEFDAMLGDYDTVLSLPGCLYAKELVELYPDAKVILTTRSTQSWVRTMHVAANQMLTWRGWGIMQSWDKSFTGSLITLVQAQMRVMCNGDFSANGWAAKKYEEHNSLVRNLVPKERLLEYDPNDGWEPLCHFLEHSRPEEPFPALDADEDDEKIVRMQKVFWFIGLARSLVKMATVFVGAPLLMVYVWFRRDDIQDILGSTFSRIGSRRNLFG
ncbi:hypothetical protein H2200_008846 [Cladophialophora chaetospira]|uniref:NAD dependent epimerase/dehydratase n=1 Tax=Cladophialophora chaetospira TaxID=386627 RepID=A0AA39CFX8_9EURO|nr:hypothetical protein H2200_008846 [Cladophialophora chaetospira]